MEFGEVTPEEAQGSILAHTVRTKEKVYQKGRVLSHDDIQAIMAEGIGSLLVASLEEHDIHEDEAALRLASAIAGDMVEIAAPFTGRSNIYATTHGLLSLNVDGLKKINLAHESLTIATLPTFKAVAPGDLLATAKVIPFSTPKERLEMVEALAADQAPLLEVIPFQPFRVGVIITRLPNTKKSLLDKTSSGLRTRMRRLGSHVSMQIKCAHDRDHVAEAIEGMVENGCDLVLVSGPTATVDRRDIIPSAFEAAGGAIKQFGIPVDPGNLLLLGSLKNSRLVGVPGCARSLALNGFDFILERLMAGLEVNKVDVAEMAIGGLLKEMSNRPQSREREKEGS